MKRAIFSKLLLFCFFITSRCFGELNDDNDFQLWFMTDVRKRISSCWEFEFQSEYRFGNDGSELFLYFFQGQVVYSPKDWLELAPGYRQQETKLLPNTDWITSYDPLIDVTFKWCLDKTKVIDRNRVQYFMQKELPDFWVFRHRDTFLFRPIGRFQPLLSEEFFFIEGLGFDQNRLEIGGTLPIRGAGNLIGVYLLRHQKFKHQWRAAHVLRFKLFFAF